MATASKLNSLAILGKAMLPAAPVNGLKKLAIIVIANNNVLFTSVDELLEGLCICEKEINYSQKQSNNKKSPFSNNRQNPLYKIVF
jgi:hypothetical protein